MHIVFHSCHNKKKTVILQKLIDNQDYKNILYNINKIV